MDLLKRKTLLGLLALPAGCAIQSLPPLPTAPLAPTGPWPGTVRAPQPGQSWTYAQFNVFNSQRVDTLQEQVRSIDAGVILQRQSNRYGALEDEVHTVWGQVSQDPGWDLLQNYENPMPLWPSDLSPGVPQDWRSHYRSQRGSFRFAISASITVAGWETVTLGGNTHQTVRLERWVRLQHVDFSRLNCLRRETLWLSPGIGRWVARETRGEYQFAGKKLDQRLEDHWRWELERWA